MRRETRAILQRRVGQLPPAVPAAYGRHRPISCREALRLDQAGQTRFGRPAGALMAQAGQGVAAVCALLLEPDEGRLLVLCGPGSNGGDGYVAAALLASRGYATEVLALAPSPAAGAAAEARRTCAAILSVAECYGDAGPLDDALARADLVLDALFGIGLSRPLDDRWRGVIESVNAAPVLRLSVDLPSGMDADTGLGQPVSVAADVTATMAAPKAGFAPGAPGAARAGRVVEVDIGLPLTLHAPLRLGP
jgi:ADP-dependent NAD(P)H-hydrate dehydratase / NAD(P)H-hydrate epimerase